MWSRSSNSSRKLGPDSFVWGPKPHDSPSILAHQTVRLTESRTVRLKKSGLSGFAACPAAGTITNSLRGSRGVPCRHDV